MRKTAFFLFLCNLLVINLLANIKFPNCRFEDGFYDSKARKHSTKNAQFNADHKFILEIEGCLLKQVVSIDGKNTSTVKISPISLDDSGIVELKIGEDVYTVTIGFEINLEISQLNVKI